MSFFDPVPLMALEQIEDTNIRTVLQSIANGLQVRNGETGTGEHAFVTRADLTRVTGVPARLGYSGQWPTLSEAMGQSTSQAITDVESAIVNSLAFQQLGDQVAQVNTDVIAEQTARIAAVQVVADDLAEEAIARLAIANDLSTLTNRVGVNESAITTLQTTTSSQATNLTSLTTRVTDAESNVTTLQTTTSSQATNLSNLTARTTTSETNISSLQTATNTQATNISSLTTRVGTAESNITSLQTTTGNQATSLSALTTRVGTAESNITNLQSTTSTTSTNLSSLTTRVGTAESNISTLQTTTSNQATTLSSLTTTIGQKARTFLQASEPTASGTGDLWFDSDDSNKPYRWSGSAWVATDDTRIAAVQASITSEATTRANDDNAITSSMSTQFSTVNGNISSLQSTQTTLSNNVSTLSSSVSTLTATVGGHTTSIQNETEARVSADGQINAKYTVKIDSNGHISGFGLISEANNSTPVSSFIVRADKFAVSNQTGSDTFVGAPFIVESGRVYMDSSYIKNLYAGSIDVEKLSGTTTTYSEAGTYTFTLPAGFTVMRVTLWAGGGGGGGARSIVGYHDFFPYQACGGGGGQGGRFVATFTGLTPGATYTVVVGAGGVAGQVVLDNSGVYTAPTSAGSGGNSSISGPGISAVAYGGSGGSSGYPINAGGTYVCGSGGGGGDGGGAGSNGAAGSGYAGSGDGGGVGGGNQTVNFFETAQFLSPITTLGIGGNGLHGLGAYYGSPLGHFDPESGRGGFCQIEAYNPNGIVKRSEWDTLIAHLNARFTSYTWP